MIHERTARADSAASGAPSPYARRVRGCLLGGALGDALGAPVEFASLAAIRYQHGPRGLEHLAPAYGRLGAITDDTQLTLFTAEGLIRASVQARERGRGQGFGQPSAVVHHAYRRWLHTQGLPWQQAAQQGEGDPGAVPTAPAAPAAPDGWLVGERFLYARRAPDGSCLDALEAPGALGRANDNDSQGCGALTRSAPIGLLFDAGGGAPTPREGIFRAAVEIAALTHGHPSAQLPAGVLATTLHILVHEPLPPDRSPDLALSRALEAAITILRRWPHHQATLHALDAARRLARDRNRPGQQPSPERVESLGAGWLADQALAIAVYAALIRPDDPRAALLLAANHSGDSDSTAALCGHLLGALHGEEALPADWLAQLEGRETIEQLADDFVLEMAEAHPELSAGGGGARGRLEEWGERYPAS